MSEIRRYCFGGIDESHDSGDREVSGDDLESEFDDEDIEVIEEASTNCVGGMDGQLGLKTYSLRLT